MILPNFTLILLKCRGVSNITHLTLDLEAPPSALLVSALSDLYDSLIGEVVGPIKLRYIYEIKGGPCPRDMPFYLVR